MPSFNKIELPVVTLSNHDCDKISAQLAGMPMPLEAMIELVIYIKRQREKVDALAIIEDVMRGKIKDLYAKLPEADRKTVRTEVGMVTMSAPGEKVELKDRDTTVESLTTEQLRITYKPDLKALETILKKDAFERLITRTPTKGVMAVKDIPASEVFHEIDF